MPNFLWKSRHSLYYFRRRIPSRYSTYFDGKAELRHSLNTSDRLTAKRRARSMAVKIDQCFQWLDQMTRKKNNTGSFSDNLQIFITSESTPEGTKTTHSLEMSVEEHEQLGD